MKPENMTILTVDDTPANVRLLTHQLEKQGYRVITAEDGFEGFKAAITYQPDLILLDIMMPGTDGYEVCELLKTEEQTRDIPVIFLTAKTDIEDRVKGFELGAVDYITKPFNLTEITARVQNQLEMRHAQRQNCRLKQILFQLHPMLPLNQNAEQLIETIPQSTLTGDLAEIREGWLSIAGSLTNETEKVNLKSWVDDVVESMQEGVSGLIGFNVNFESTHETVTGYSALLHLALLNVVINAYEAMNSKGMIEIKKSTGVLPKHLIPMMQSEISETYHMIEVIDKGIPDGRSVFNIKKPYEIKDSDFKEFTMRLAAVYGIMKLHQGIIDVSSHDEAFHTVLYLPNE
jgi:DNA-binding response OmpR family regulator